MVAPIAVAAKLAAQQAAKRAAKKKANQDGGKGKWALGGGGAVLLVGTLILSLIITMISVIFGILGGSSGGSLNKSCVDTSNPSTVAVADIPPVALEAYQKAGTATGVNWVYIAAIGKIETDHGRFGGRTLDANGNETPTPIVNSIGASGPMQFMPATWASYGKDGNADGKTDIQNIYDAALGTGFYLKANGAPKDMRKAIFAYNHATWYVNKVIAQAKKYAAASLTVKVNGGVTGNINGAMSMAQANIPTRSGPTAFTSTVRTIISTKSPDFISLNEQSARSLDFIKSAATGYNAYRNPDPGDNDGQALDSVVLWKASDYKLLDSGRVQLVDNDHTSYDGHPVTWDRFAQWVLLQRISDGSIVSVVATHMMTNPAKYGPNKELRQQQYGQGMDLLISLVDQLQSHGPVFVGGDFNTFGDYTQHWAAAPKMSGAGFGNFNNDVDFLFYQANLGIKVVATDFGPTPEPDHRWIYARYDMNGAGAAGGPKTAADIKSTVHPSKKVLAQIAARQLDGKKNPTEGNGNEGGSTVTDNVGGQTSTNGQTSTSNPTQTTNANGWVMPVGPGYVLGMAWGVAGPLWSSGYHTGQDFIVPTGTPVYAAHAGTVVARPDQASWAGQYFLTIDHGIIDGHSVFTWYAHLSKDIVTSGPVVAGQEIGLSGALGNVTGPHLHFEVRVDGKDVDPMPWLAGAGVPTGGGGQTGGNDCGNTGTSGIVGGNGAWGGYKNGQIPLSAMCKLSFYNTYLECHAAAAMEQLNKAYEQQFGVSVGPVGGYRSYAEQVICRQEKGNLCAVPGTSNHGWGLAADLAGGGINEFGTPQHNWMVANANQYGWVHPSWAEPNGSKPEPWHWEFAGTGNQAQDPTGTTTTTTNTQTTNPGKKGGGGGKKPGKGSTPPPVESTAAFRFADWNMLGAAHTEGPGCNKCVWPDSDTRTPKAVNTINSYNPDVMTFQEFEPKQQAQFKNLVGSQWTLYGNQDNVVAWKTNEFSVVSQSTFAIPYFGGQTRYMPLVKLKTSNGTKFAVISVHNPADTQDYGKNQQYRDQAIQIENGIIKNLVASGIPVYLAGDMNDRESFFCDITKPGVMAAAAGGSNNGTCNPPGNMEIDWITGNKTNISFSGYKADHGPEGLSGASDHPIIVTDTAITANTSE